ncbi:hypothetical protein [Arcicella lustrica]|uniref:Uncharacterized protein n=1 Tax=Arcicella lustrica TaxID=2984196 RepID=A0ABU5SDI4_9BACT|nr:hypothetical protein [Arcicella sp. DC25W]MEA5425356.1 hypothetical protein [Arcicella sp. DC25W]
MNKYKLGDKVLSPSKLIVNGIRAEEVEVKSISGALGWPLSSDLVIGSSRNEKT